MTLTPQEMQRIYEIQRQMHQKFRDVTSAYGQDVSYLGRLFVVDQGVFWPSWDSQALVKNYVINSGEDVCDVCTGSGVIAVYSAEKGARKVVALDINPNAIKSTKTNAKIHGVENIVDARQSDMFSALREGEMFDVVTMNPPFTNHREELYDYAEKTVWDQDLYVQRKFFEGLPRVLKPTPNARAYVAGASFGAIDEFKERAKQAGFSMQEIGKTVVDDLRTFYAFELRRKK
jgi:release factor glutamine methyltransferase